MTSRYSFTFFIHQCLSSVPLKVCSQMPRFQALWIHVRIFGMVFLGLVRAESPSRGDSDSPDPA